MKEQNFFGQDANYSAPSRILFLAHLIALSPNSFWLLSS